MRNIRIFKLRFRNRNLRMIKSSKRTKKQYFCFSFYLSIVSFALYQLHCIICIRRTKKQTQKSNILIIFSTNQLQSILKAILIFRTLFLHCLWMRSISNHLWIQFRTINVLKGNHLLNTWSTRIDLPWKNWI